MNKIIKWIHNKWLHLRLRYLYAQLNDEQIINVLREMRYIVWQQKMDPAKISPYHRKVH